MVGRRSRFRVYPGHLFARRFQRQPAVSDWGEFAIVAHAGNEFFSGKTDSGELPRSGIGRSFSLLSFCHRHLYGSPFWS